MNTLKRTFRVTSIFGLGIMTSFCMSEKNFERMSSLVLPEEEKVEPVDFVKGGVVLPTLLPFFALVDE